MRVSARLHATAAPEAPAPIIRTSTISSVGRAALGLASAAISLPPPLDVAPHSWPAAYHIQQGPITLFQHVTLRIGRTWFETERAHHAVVAVIALQYGAPECRHRRAFAAEQGHRRRLGFRVV